MALKILAFLAMVALIFATTTTANPIPAPINPLCEKANDKVMCSKMIGGANNPQDATDKAIRATLFAVTKTKSLFDALKKALARIPNANARDSIFKVCSDNYDGAVDNLNLALEDLKNNEYAGMSDKISSSKLTECTDALVEEHVTSPLVAFAVRELDMLDACLTTSLDL